MGKIRQTFVMTMAMTPPHPRILGPVNWLGLWVLTCKETERFTKIYLQTILAPLVTTLLYYLVFNIALGGPQRMIGTVPYLSFLVPGLIIMSMAQNAFTSTSSSIVISKVQGNIVDVLMPPLSPMELTLGYTFGGLARGLTVGFFSIIVLTFIIDLPITNLAYIIYHAVMGSMMLALLGLVGGIWSNRFDHLAVVQNFIIMPATFLSGTFYSADKLPAYWRYICHLNPFFYMIDGFRYGFVGLSDGTTGTGLVVLAVSNIFLLGLAWWMFSTGYKLKS
jgi:ABC-2 type transport system permease protein